MKHLLAIGGLVALFGAASPAFAICPTDVFHPDVDASLPAVCKLAATKDAHPEWYRDGGYCTGGAQVSQDVTGFGHYACKVED